MYKDSLSRRIMLVGLAARQPRCMRDRKVPTGNRKAKRRPTQLCIHTLHAFLASSAYVKCTNNIACTKVKFLELLTPSRVLTNLSASRWQ